MKISAVLITYNEEDRLRDALQSCLSFADECVVVDGQSTDHTTDIAREMGARVISHPFKDFGSQKDFARKQAKYDWVLNLDADERVSPQLKDAILRLKNTPPPPQVRGYRIRRKTAYLGRWIGHSGWYPDRKIRLFARDQSHWEGHVHERLHVNGEIRNLPGHILHFTYRDIEDHVSRLNRYSSMQAEDLLKRGKRFLLFQALIKPPVTFLRFFFWKGGIRDGFPGLVIALVSSWATALKYLKARSLRCPSPPPEWDRDGH